jgi:hypothetical protein
MKRIKFKYYQGNVHLWENEDLKEDFGKNVESPLPYKKMPNGVYLIRGNEKSHRKEYWVLNNKWYLVSDVKKDNGHYLCDSATFNLFPQLSEKEWNNILKIPNKCFNKLWQRHIYGYWHWKNMRELRKEIFKK